MHTNTPRQYTDIQVREFLTEAIEARIESTRNDLDLPVETLEYILDIARYILTKWKRD